MESVLGPLQLDNQLECCGEQPLLPRVPNYRHKETPWTGGRHRYHAEKIRMHNSKEHKDEMLQTFEIVNLRNAFGLHQDLKSETLFTTWTIGFGV